MSARKCKVCGLSIGRNAYKWCARCVNASFSVADSSDFQRIAEWGAKRRAAASKKAGGK